MKEAVIEVTLNGEIYFLLVSRVNDEIAEKFEANKESVKVKFGFFKLKDQETINNEENAHSK